jgi:hypothetical protein
MASSFGSVTVLQNSNCFSVSFLVMNCTGFATLTILPWRSSCTGIGRARAWLTSRPTPEVILFRSLLKTKASQQSINLNQYAIPSLLL